MPLYEYECESCGRRFERIQKFSDPLVTECPACGKGPVKKLFSSPAIQFKGSGFYITDYAKAGKSGESEGSKKSTEKPDGESAKSEKSEPSKSDKSEKSESTSTTAKSESSSDTKPAEKKKAD